MKRIPVFATLVVLAAVATMVGLGFWQIGRAHEKEAALMRIARNGADSPLALEYEDLTTSNLLRPVATTCRQASATRIAGAGEYGFRVIGDCFLPDDATIVAVQLGTQRRPVNASKWSGGKVRGYLAQAPDNRSLLRQLFDRRPARMMIVADPPLAGLAPSPRPSVADIPNNHRSYAFQWFAFAGIALVIYAIALRGRWRRG